ncbi:hypothetical protein [Streptococcus suis]|uniref:Uncharacterized protein n=1 Tax=Streptococcus suis TaxID=1307 RepID=A0A0Z8HHU8_STRSU|nr:hypothetical protein [Streptococcus suis]AND00477.1 hypothetical protein A6M16_08290 [Streptococcus suis]AOM75202.1 hypothetical protein BFP66_08190 [Streptococcus suis]MBL6514288.1 hypothetical protein [Streptococcus suis]MBS8058382.1 hypothetical protein [Streptococcus suis]MBS8113649.1 hypothetical protein [Streptococcus suis]
MIKGQISQDVPHFTIKLTQSYDHRLEEDLLVNSIQEWLEKEFRLSAEHIEVYSVRLSDADTERKEFNCFVYKHGGSSLSNLIPCNPKIPIQIQGGNPRQIRHHHVENIEWNIK